MAGSEHQMHAMHEMADHSMHQMQGAEMAFGATCCDDGQPVSGATAAKITDMLVIASFLVMALGLLLTPLKRLFALNPFQIPIKSPPERHLHCSYQI